MKTYNLLLGLAVLMGLGACTPSTTDTTSTPSPSSTQASPGPILGTPGPPLGTLIPTSQSEVMLKDLQVGQTVIVARQAMLVDTNKHCWLPLDEKLPSFGVRVGNTIEVTRLKDGYYVSELAKQGYIAGSSSSQMVAPKYAPVLNCATPGKAEASGQQIADVYRILTAGIDLKVVKEGWVDLPDSSGFVPPVYISASGCYINPTAFLNSMPRPSNAFDVAWNGNEYIINGPYEDTVSEFQFSSAGRRGVNPASEWLPARCPKR